MKISILSSDPYHPVIEPLTRWCDIQRSAGHEVDLVFSVDDLKGGDFLFLVSCAHFVKESDRMKFRHVLVLHASDLPVGRGWSPHIWAVINGSNSITVSLLEAGDKIDTGRIWLKREFFLEGHELHSEINSVLFDVELELMSEALLQHLSIVPFEQKGCSGAYLRKRRPGDGRLCPDKTIAEQFDEMRVADPVRYPSFFDYRGKRYKLVIEKVDGQ